MKKVQVPQTFLWKQPENNAVLAEIKNKAAEKPYFLTADSAMTLYREKLVDSQLLYGEEVEVLAKTGEWTQVLVPTQPVEKGAGYKGWIPSEDLLEVPAPKKDFPKVAVVSPSATLSFDEKNDKKKIQVVFGTVLPLLSEETDFVVETPHGTAHLAKKEGQRLDQYSGVQKAQNMIQLAQYFLDLPYVWAGIGGTGFDCSGFVYSLHRVNGMKLPRDAHLQAIAGEKIEFADAQAGDLLFFAYEEGKGFVHHVGMYLGNGAMIHSQTPGSKVMITKIAGTKYETELSEIRRFWKM